MILQFNVQRGKQLLPTTDQMEIFKELSEAAHLLDPIPPFIAKVVVTLVERPSKRIDVNLQSQIFGSGTLQLNDISVFEYSLFNLQTNVQRALQQCAKKAVEKGFVRLDRDVEQKIPIAA